MKQRGQSIVEFSLLAPILLILLMGVVDLGRVIQAQTRINTAAHQAILLVQQQENQGSSSVSAAGIAAQIQQSYDGTSVVITPSTIGRNTVYTATVTVSFSPISPMVAPLLNITSIHSTATGRSLP